ncbi:MAG: dihydroorotate dehydrogenase [Candidatus Altiarchaeota archaeon]
MDISTKISGIKLENPTILASGILGTSAASLIRVARSGAGAVTTKSISMNKRAGHKGPVIVEIQDGLLNAVGLSSAGVQESCEEIKKFISATKTPIIASFFSRSVEEFAELAEKISEAKPNFLEANISCPNLKGKIIGTDAKLSTKVVEKIKERTEIPLIVKLTPNTPDIVKIAKAVESAGADAISAINTLGPGMKIDIKLKKPILGNKFGGVSGPCIKPIAVRCVYHIYEAVKIPIIGIGGITKAEDAIEMLMAGASAVGIGTGILYRDLKIFREISRGIENFMRENNYKNLRDIIGAAH